MIVAFSNAKGIKNIFEEKQEQIVTSLFNDVFQHFLPSSFLLNAKYGQLTENLDDGCWGCVCLEQFNNTPVDCLLMKISMDREALDCLSLP